MLCVWVFCLHVNLYTICMFPGTKLQIIVSCRVGAANQTQILCCRANSPVISWSFVVWVHHGNKRMAGTWLLVIPPKVCLVTQLPSSEPHMLRVFSSPISVISWLWGDTEEPHGNSVDVCTFAFTDRWRLSWFLYIVTYALEPLADSECTQDVTAASCFRATIIGFWVLPESADRLCPHSSLAALPRSLALFFIFCLFSTYFLLRIPPVS